jgi:ribosomal protein RSM22 (predicted rRNA methylase)
MGLRDRAASPHVASLVHALEDEWQAVLDGVLAKMGAPRTSDVARLAPKLAELSRAYNEGAAGADKKPVPLEARVAFSFARDVPKGAAAVRELVAADLLSTPLRILDIGAGLGAMTWGVVRALEAAGKTGRVEALLVDVDARALEVASKIANAAPRGSVELAITTRTQRVGAKLPQADLVIVGQVLSELDNDIDATARVEKHAALVSDLLRDSVAEGGALVIVEPALRERTRHLHAVRDRLVGRGATVFAPCLHAEACPALVKEDDWCHEDVAVDLPPWLVPLARAAGLRFQGLTFSHLVLRKDEGKLVTRLREGGLRLRVVSDVLRTKGKTEIFACTAAGQRVRLRRLERDEKASPSAWDELNRGDVLTVSPAPDENGRLATTVEIDVWPPRH